MTRSKISAAIEDSAIDKSLWAFSAVAEPEHRRVLPGSAARFDDSDVKSEGRPVNMRVRP
ncbi:MAG TPA: hypothetical protein VN911_04500 [Candidatus Acidoferrum sp.]|nr:hypothetical protein [Candidatus Acidoferrum sp.]